MGSEAGVLNLLKPPGMTSHDVVQFVRRRSGWTRVGHTGTLDPLAAGVLLLVAGRATRTARYFTDLDKSYRVEAVFGIETASGDADGAVLHRRPAASLTREAVERAAGRMTGVIRQRPPRFSAVRVAGRRMYQRARRGERVQAPEREVRVDAFDLLEWRPGPQPAGLFHVRCGSGTYIRSLVTELGRALGTGAYVRFLLRTSVGPWTTAEAVTLEEASGDWQQAVMPLEDALSFLPSVTVGQEAAVKVAHGRPLPCPDSRLGRPGSPLRVLGPDGGLLAVARCNGTVLRYDLVLVAPEEVR